MVLFQHESDSGERLKYTGTIVQHPPAGQRAVVYSCSCCFCSAARPRGAPAPGRWSPARRTLWGWTSGSRTARRCIRQRRSPRTLPRSHLRNQSFLLVISVVLFWWVECGAGLPMTQRLEMIPLVRSVSAIPDISTPCHKRIKRTQYLCTLQLIQVCTVQSWNFK